MGKEFTGYIPEATQYLNGKITLSIWCYLSVAKPNRFAELLDSESKVKIGLQEGKGDSSTRVTFNLTVEEFEFIYDFYMNGRLKVPHSIIKPLQTPCKTGDYVGKFFTSTFNLEYLQGYDNPWKISIQNGYGSKMSEFDVAKKYVKTFMTDAVLHKLLTKTKEYIDVFRYSFCSENIRNGVKECAKFQRGAYDPFKENNDNMDLSENVHPENMMPTDNSQIQNNVQNNQSQPSTQSNQQSQARDIKTMKLQAVSEPIAFQNSFVVSVMIGGMQYSLYCQKAYPELIQSYNDGVIIEANLFDYNGKLCLDSIKK